MSEVRCYRVVDYTYRPAVQTGYESCRVLVAERRANAGA